jgi:hypothetical protein
MFEVNSAKDVDIERVEQICTTIDSHNVVCWKRRHAMTSYQLSHLFVPFRTSALLPLLVSHSRHASSITIHGPRSNAFSESTKHSNNLLFLLSNSLCEILSMNNASTVRSHTASHQYQPLSLIFYRTPFH